MLPVRMEAELPMALEAIVDAAVTIWEKLVKPAIKAWRSL